MYHFTLTIDGDEILGVYANSFQEAGITVIDSIGNPWILIHSGHKVCLDIKE